MLAVCSQRTGSALSATGRMLKADKILTACWEFCCTADNLTQFITWAQVGLVESLLESSDRSAGISDVQP